MFKSISVAVPNSIVTSSFTATEVCTVDFGENFTVRVAGQVVSTRPIVLAIGDQIEVDIVAPAANTTKYVEWFYNGNQCYFAVVANQGTTRPTLRPQYKNLLFTEYSGQAQVNGAFVKKPTQNDDYAVSGNSWTNGPFDRDLVITFLPNDDNVRYLWSNDQYDYSLFSNTTVKSFAWLRNPTLGSRDQIFLLGNGSLAKVRSDKTQTKGTVGIHTGATCLFSDGYTVFVGGPGILYSTSDLNTIAVNYPTTETILGGAACGPTAIVATKSGKLMKLTNGTLQEIYSAETLGQPSVFRNKFIVPVPTEYKLRIYNLDLTLHTEIDTGDYLPWATCSFRDRSFTMTAYESKDVFVYTDFTSAPTKITFNRNTTWCVQYEATLFGTYMIYYASSLLGNYDTVAPANPLISGATFPTWTAPIDVDTGSGDKTITSLGEPTTASSAPNGKLLVNSAISTATKNGDRVSVIMRSTPGKRSTAIQLGHYAFDFVVNGTVTESRATYVQVPPQGRSNLVSFGITVPPKTDPAPVALSHGTLTRNGVAYDGVTPVSAGDILVANVYLPTDASYYFSMLSIADSQYALVANRATTYTSDIQRYQPYGGYTTKSTITVNETGTFDFPNYSHGQVSKNGQVLSFPTELQNGDTLEITHTRMSQWWLDERDTILIGPTANFIVKGTTEVDDMPVDMDFGIVHLGIPDFEFPGDLIPTMEGLSDGYEIVIYGDGLRFGVNGADPVDRPSVKNGDQIQAFYTVKNLFDDQYAKTLLLSGDEYEFGSIGIDSALGEYNVPGVENFYLPTNWAEYDQQSLATALASVSSFETHVPVSNEASVGLLVQESKDLKTQAATGLMAFLYSIGTTDSPTSKQGFFGTSSGATQSAPSMWDRPEFAETKTSDLSVETSRFTYAGKQVNQNYMMSFGHTVLPLPVEPYWLQNTDVSPPKVEPTYLYRGNALEYKFSPTFVGWNLLQFITFTGIWEKSQFEFRTWAPVWMLTNPYGVNRFGPDWFCESDQNRPETYGEFLFADEAWDHVEMIALDPQFVSTRHAGDFTHDPLTYPQAGLFYGQNIAEAPKPTSLFSVASGGGWYVADVLWDTNLPDETGGYETEETALEAAQAITTTLEITTYQQPEGTFSYVLKRDTSLVCEIQPSGLVARAWLLGGG